MYVLSVEKTGDRKEAAQKELLLHGAETRWRRKVIGPDGKWSVVVNRTKYMPVRTVSVHWTYVYVLVYTMLGWK